MFAELRKIETLKSFWEQSVINVHRYEANKAVQNKMLEKLVKIDLLDIWKFLRLLVTNFPTQIDLKEVEWKSWCNEKVNSSGLVLSVQSTEKGYGKVRIQKPGVVLNEVNEIENIRFDSIWRLVACFANHLIRVNLITRTGKKD
ncbi:MAG: hypothetical protein GY866_29765 [Proteobacteria bacterium]|nr:hypothetical protein [Pseudomonadota bacterium]